MQPRRAVRALTAAVVTVLLSAAVATAAVAQAQPATPATARPAAGTAHETHEDEGHAIPWKALDTYHTVMAASWHPAKDRNDLAPFRARAAELVTAAKALTAEPVPAACGGPARAGNVAAVVRASEEAARMVGARGVTDEQLKAALRRAHDTFHTVEEGCAAPGAAKH